jgi:hypothetical protein
MSEHIAVVAPRHDLAVHWFHELCVKLQERGGDWRSQRTFMRIADLVENKEYHFYTISSPDDDYKLRGIAFDQFIIVEPQLHAPNIISLANSFMKPDGKLSFWADRRERLVATIEIKEQK